MPLHPRPLNVPPAGLVIPSCEFPHTMIIHLRECLGEYLSHCTVTICLQVCPPLLYPSPDCELHRDRAVSKESPCSHCVPEHLAQRMDSNNIGWKNAFRHEELDSDIINIFREIYLISFCCYNLSFLSPPFDTKTFHRKQKPKVIHPSRYGSKAMFKKIMSLALSPACNDLFFFLRSFF